MAAAMAALVRPRTYAALRCQRTFSTTIQRSGSLALDSNDQEVVKDILPEYPYGPTRWYKQSRLGLYGGQRIRFGNNVGPKTAVKTRRAWHPNVHNKRLFSKALNRTVQLRITTRTLRTIDKVGGLDEYLLGEKEARIKQLGETGWWLRWAIMQTPEVRDRFAAEKGLLGLDELVETLPHNEYTAANQIAGAMTPSPQIIAQSATSSRPIRFRVDRRDYLKLTPEGWNHFHVRSPVKGAPVAKFVPTAQKGPKLPSNKAINAMNQIIEAQAEKAFRKSQGRNLSTLEERILRDKIKQGVRASVLTAAGYSPTSEVMQMVGQHSRRVRRQRGLRQTESGEPSASLDPENKDDQRTGV